MQEKVIFRKCKRFHKTYIIKKQFNWIFQKSCVTLHPKRRIQKNQQVLKAYLTLNRRYLAVISYSAYQIKTFFQQHILSL